MNKPIKRLNVKEKLLGITVVLPEAYYCGHCNEFLRADKPIIVNGKAWWTERECPHCGTKIDWED